MVKVGPTKTVTFHQRPEGHRGRSGEACARQSEQRVRASMRHRCTWESQGPSGGQCIWARVSKGREWTEGVTGLDLGGLGGQKVHRAEVWHDLTCISNKSV